MKQIPRVATRLFAFIFVLITAFQAEASVRTAPFQEGEKLLYRAKWGAISAGEAMIETLPLQTIQGRQSYHFALTAKTSRQIDTFYAIWERQDSYTDLDLTQTLHYAKRGTGRRSKDVVVKFDW